MTFFDIISNVLPEGFLVLVVWYFIRQQWQQFYVQNLKQDQITEKNSRALAEVSKALAVA